MNADRRASLQRKLAVAPVPKPPAGLAAKIKSDIPQELRFSAERERARLVQSVRLSMAVAASVIVVIATAYLALQVTSTTSVEQTARPATATRAPIPVLQAPAALPPAAAPKVAPQRKEERRFALHRAKKQAMPPPPEAPAAVAAPAAEAMPNVAVAADRAMTKSIAAEEAKSPISGNVMGAAGAPVVPWKNASRETKIKILKEELARGADPKEVARVAREAGLDEFADSLEKH
jgi:type IV secretory pathway VirB10-like protein